MKEVTFSIHESAEDLPQHWDDLAQNNTFLCKEYLAALANATAPNISNYFISFFQNDELIAVCTAQCINLKGQEVFRVEGKRLSTKIKCFLRQFVNANLLVIGNMTLTGENGFWLKEDVTWEAFLPHLKQAIIDLRKNLKPEGKKIHLTTFKDYYMKRTNGFDIPAYQKYYRFKVQPNMIMEIPEIWNSWDDYLMALKNKYRTRYRRAKKKLGEVEMRILTLDEVKSRQEEMHQLYKNVSDQARFNTFVLPENHFYELKRHLKDRMIFLGYFEGENLLSFCTIVDNGTVMETYFLGYDEELQRDKQLYLNMIYDMLQYAVEHEYKKVLFGRTALEIKSTLGAVPVEIFGLIKHETTWINHLMNKIFPYFSPQEQWEQRHPFKK